MHSSSLTSHKFAGRKGNEKYSGAPRPPSAPTWPLHICRYLSPLYKEKKNCPSQLVAWAAPRVIYSGKQRLDGAEHKVEHEQDCN